MPSPCNRLSVPGLSLSRSCQVPPGPYRTDFGFPAYRHRPGVRQPSSTHRYSDPADRRPGPRRFPTSVPARCPGPQNSTRRHQVRCRPFPRARRRMASSLAATSRLSCRASRPPGCCGRRRRGHHAAPPAASSWTQTQISCRINPRSPSPQTPPMTAALAAHHPFPAIRMSLGRRFHASTQSGPVAFTCRTTQPLIGRPGHRDLVDLRHVLRFAARTRCRTRCATHGPT